MKAYLKIIIALLIFSDAVLTQTDSTLITLDRIFAKREFYQKSFGRSQWFDDGNSYTKLEKAGNGRNIVAYNSETGEKSILVEAKSLIPNGENKPLSIYNYKFSDDFNLLLIFTNTKRVWRANTRGDYWVLNRETNTLKKLGGKNAKPSTLMFATLSPDNKYVAYVRENNIFVESVDGEEIIQLTHDGSETIINGTFDWVYEEELKLRNGFRWSPDSKRIAFWQLDASGIGVFNMINYTDSIYSKIIPVQYPKAGTKNSAARAGVVELASKEIKWFDLPGDPRNNYIARMSWAASSEEVIIQQLNRLQNQNKVFLGNALSGKVKNIFIDKDDAWVEAVDDLKWFNDGKYFTWLSERDGWRHVYLISRDGKNIKNITPGNYDVISIVGIDQKFNYIYFIASPDNPTQRYLYRKSIFGNEEKEIITPENFTGTNSYNISPNFKWAIHTYSNINTPPVKNLISIPDHKVIRELQSNKKLVEKLSKLNVKPITFFRVKASDGTPLDGFKILPPDFDESKKYPVLFYVYGEPAGQTVRDAWMRSYYYHQMLAQNGYIVISIDNRGTPSPRGREFRKSIYGQIGIISSADQADALREISKWQYIDTTRVGIWGWSGGGSMSLNAIFRYPDLYKTAVAVAPVGDLKLYDTIYEERYMGLPSTNPEGYKNGSPVTFAKNLKGNLLIIHGTGDDNVHYQNSEVVINELIKHNKLFSMIAYPNRSHGIYEGKNTSRHVYETMFNYIINNL